MGSATYVTYYYGAMRRTSQCTSLRPYLARDAATFTMWRKWRGMVFICMNGVYYNGAQKVKYEGFECGFLYGSATKRHSLPGSAT